MDVRRLAELKAKGLPACYLAISYHFCKLRPRLWLCSMQFLVAVTLETHTRCVHGSHPAAGTVTAEEERATASTTPSTTMRGPSGKTESIGTITTEV